MFRWKHATGEFEECIGGVLQPKRAGVGGELFCGLWIMGSDVGELDADACEEEGALLSLLAIVGSALPCEAIGESHMAGGVGGVMPEHDIEEFFCGGVVLFVKCMFGAELGEEPWFVGSVSWGVVEGL